jgi:uncharacterized protein (DUF488 family)
MLKRQKVLLNLISTLREHDKPVTKTFLDKLLFLLREEYGIGDIAKFYNFYPYQYGPFSSRFYFDLSDLQSRGYLDPNFYLNAEGRRIADNITGEQKQMIEELIGRFNQQSIVEYVYDRYPEYTTKSLLKIRTPEKTNAGIFTIGYEGKDIDLFLNLLIRNKIQVLVDVRANPFSMNFSFIRNKLEKSLKKVDIEYLHIPQLGIEGENRKKLDTYEDYQRLFEFYKASILSRQTENLRMLEKLGKTKSIALMCFEADKNFCHRGVISQKLEENGLEVVHI